jgi:hypothetical protein
MTHANPLRRLALIVPIALAAGGALGGIAMADNAAPNHGSDSPGRAEVLRFYGHANLDAEVYVRANGKPPPASADDSPAAGDVSILQDDLFALDPRTNTPKGPQLGTHHLECTFTRVDGQPFTNVSADVLCHGLLRLPQGTITVQAFESFVGRDNHVLAFAVTGGTGAYADAGGEGTARALPPSTADDAAIYDIHLEHLATQH